MAWQAGWVWLQRGEQEWAGSHAWRWLGWVRGWRMDTWRQFGCMRRGSACPTGEAPPYGTVKGKTHSWFMQARKQLLSLPACRRGVLVWVCCSRPSQRHSLRSSSNMIQASLFWKAPHIHKHMYRRHVNCSLCWEQSCWIYTLQPERKGFLLQLVLVCGSVRKLHIFLGMLCPQRVIRMHGGKKETFAHNPVSSSALLLHIVSTLNITASTHLQRLWINHSFDLFQKSRERRDKVG